MKTAFKDHKLFVKVTAFWPENGEREDRSSADSPVSTELSGQTLGGSETGGGISKENRRKGKREKKAVEGDASETSGQKSKLYSQKIDLSIFRARGVDPLPAAHSSLTDSEKKTSKSVEYKATLDYSARTSWDHVVVPIEVKPSRDPPAFDINGLQEFPARETAKGEQTKGQMAEYISKIGLRQHRTHLFSIYIHGRKVFLLRWDRVGVMVCRPFDLKHDSLKLHRFLYRLEKMTPSQQGYDPTIHPANEAEIKQYKEFEPANDFLKQCKQEAFQWHLYRVDVPGWKSLPTLRLIIGKPRFYSHSVVGRVTRGYVAYDLDNNCFVFMKDTWRPVTKGVLAELEVYERLVEKNVIHIATPLAGGDVKVDGARQYTRTQKYSGSDEHKAFDRRAHYRFVVQQVGRPLEQYKTAAELVSVVYCALLGMSVSLSP